MYIMMNEENTNSLVYFGYIVVALTLLSCGYCISNKKSENYYFVVPLKNVIIDELPSYENKKNDKL